MVSNIIQLKNINHQYKNKYILKDINVNISKNINMIIGSSGSGKTTLLNIMSGIQIPTSGTVIKSSDNIGCLFQHHFLIYELTVEENLQLAMSIKKTSYSIEYILNELDIKDKINEYPDNLSVGEQQRVALARVLISDPDIIFADEPTASIDPKNADRIMSILLNLHSTIILTTHNYHWIDKADEVIDINSLTTDNFSK